MAKEGCRFIWIDEVSFNVRDLRTHSWQSKMFWDPVR